MKVVSQDGGLASLFFVTPDEVKPLKGFHMLDLLRAVAQRYDASSVPSLDQVRQHGAKFPSCRLRKDDKDISIKELGIYNDAISAITTDTKDSETVLDDLFLWLKESFAFREPTKIVRLYQSDLVVQFDSDVSKPFGAISKFMHIIQKELTPQDSEYKKPIQFKAIAFGADPLNGTVTTPEFTIERRINVPWSLGMYFSKAHMQTSAHIRALELLDGLLGDKH